MKIQQRTQTSISNKKLKKTGASTSFSALFATQESKPSDSEVAQKDKHKHEETHNEQTQPLEKVLGELEHIMHNLDEGSHNYKHAQRAIHSLRDALHDMPNALPLSEQDREEAKTLLIIESKRIDELRKYEA